ncbi:MAG: HAMP domain-containing sensor histidine kinase [Cyanobacteria bacterium P01_H01_bin.74]
MIRFNMPKLRIYQQILIGFIVTITIPLTGVAFLIHQVNQKAMKKEMARFTKHTAEALYKDFDTEMSWQKQQSQMMAQLISNGLGQKQPFEALTETILNLDNSLESVGLYNQSGQLIQAKYRRFEAVSPELRLPDQIAVSSSDSRQEEKTSETSAATFQLATDHPFQVLYFSESSLGIGKRVVQDGAYYLRAAIPLPSQKSAIPHSAIKTNNSRNQVPVFYVQQKSFDYLSQLVQQNNSLYDAFYIIDNDGFIIAGPESTNLQARITDKDLKAFQKIRPGVTHEFLSETLANTEDSASRNRKNKAYKKERLIQKEKETNDADDPEPLKKVIVKMPDINWGIIIESPYHMKQKYIARANTQTLLLILGCLAIIMALVLPYIFGISRNFRQLIKGVKAVGEGNYYRRIRLITNIFTPYEIVYLTVEFNRMARKTAESWQGIQEANEKLAKLDEFKSNLIDTISHELRTPLTSIKGYTSRLLRNDKTLDSEARVKSLKVVKRQADRLSRLVEDLLVIPDLESSGLRVYLDEVVLAPAIEGAVQFIQAKSECQIETEYTNNLTAGSIRVLADPDRLEQILLNLLDNAVKYSVGDAPIVVTVGEISNPNPQAPSLISNSQTAINTRPESEDSNDMPQESGQKTSQAHSAAGNILPAGSQNTHSFIWIAIKNPCEKLSEDQACSIDSLFDKFKRLDDSLVRTTRGSGLGLFITKGLVEAMGGSIQLTYLGNAASLNHGQFSVEFTVPYIFQA